MLLVLAVLFYAMVVMKFILLFRLYLNAFLLDSLVKKLEELEQTANLFRGLIRHSHRILLGIYELSHIHRSFGDAFANIGAREPQFTASQAFTKFGNAHRQIDRNAIAFLKTAAPV